MTDLSKIKVHVAGTVAWYDTDATGLAGNAQRIQDGFPSGFGIQATSSTVYRVLLDKDRARVFVKIPEFDAWAPVLWLDRFGHWVSFAWTKKVQTGYSSFAVSAMNHLNKGVQVQWNSASHGVYVRYIGVCAPSISISGMAGGSSTRPSGYSVINPPPSISLDTVQPRIPGPFGRPTIITMGDFSSIPAPSPAWAYEAFPAAVHDAETAENRTWQFGWDANIASILSISEPSGLVTRFTYVQNALQMNASAFWGIAESETKDYGWPAGSQALATHKRKWSWNASVGSVAGVTVQESFGSLSEVPSTEYAFFTDSTSIHTNNGATQIIKRKDKAGNLISTTTYGLKPKGVAPSLSKVQTVTTTGVPGQPDRKVVIETDALGIRNLRTREYIGASSAEYQITENTYDPAGTILVLDPARVRETKVTRKNPDTGATLSPSAITRTDYGFNGLPMNVYQRSASGLEAGSRYEFDTEGRLTATLPYPASNTFWKTTLTPQPGSSWGTRTSTTAFKNPGDSSSSFSGSLVSEVLSVDSADRPLQVQDDRGVLTTTTYDFYGRPCSVQTQGSGIIRYTYTKGGREITTKAEVAKKVDQAVVEVQTHQQYDGFGRLLLETNADGVEQSYAYDEIGLLIKHQMTSGAGTVRNPTTTVFDAMGRPTTITSPDGSLQTLEYGVSGNNKTTKLTRTITTLNESGQSTSTTAVATQFVNALGQTIKVVQETGAITTLDYDGLGNQVKSTLTPADGSAAQARTSTYDDLGRLLTTTDPETGTITNGFFNTLGLPTTIREASGRTRTLTYDGLGRVRNISTTGGSESTSSLSYTYVGSDLTQAMSVCRGSGISTSYAYQGTGKRLSLERTTLLQTGSISEIKYAYDGYGNLETLTYPNQRQAVYTYGDGGRVKTITYNGIRVMSDFLVDEWGNRKELSFGSGAYSRWSTQDQGMHLKEWTIGYANTDFPGAKRSYVFDSANRLLQAGEWTLRHNVANQVTSATYAAASGSREPGFKSALAYDGYGNNTASTNTPNSGTLPTSMINYSVNAQPTNRMPGTTTTGALTGWNINTDGEATSIGASTGAVSSIALGWDGLGRLVSASNPAISPSAIQSYYYDAQGLRTLLMDLGDATRSRFYSYNSAGMLLSESTISTFTPPQATNYAPVHAPRLVITTPTPADPATGPRIAITKPTGSGYVNIGTSVDFQGTFTLGAASSSLNIVPGGPTYSWNFGDGGTATGAAPRYTFSKAGIYTVKLTVQVSTQPIVTGVPSSQIPITNHTFTKQISISVIPQINSFTATLGMGGTCQLAWNVTGASSVSINGQAVTGTTLNLTSLTTTNFILTTTNAGGSESTTLVIPYIPAAPTWKRDVIYLGNEPIAEADGAGIHELHKDHLGTPRLITKGGTGQIEDRQTFGPFGESVSEGSTYKPLTGYTGHIQTDATGLIYMRGRYYSPGWHRFLSSDHGADGNSPNQFAYVAGSPFHSVDPTGMYIYYLEYLDASLHMHYNNFQGPDFEARAAMERYAAGLGISPQYVGSVGEGYNTSYTYTGAMEIAKKGDDKKQNGVGTGNASQTDKGKKPCVTRAQILAEAAKWEGTPYGHGKQIPGTCGDCSGSVMAIYRSLGLNIALGSMPSGSSAQGVSTSSTLTSAANPRPGDIVYWNAPFHHTMIYAGNGMVWGASRPRKPFGYRKENDYGTKAGVRVATPQYFTHPNICD